jgi:hypothetical protein
LKKGQKPFLEFPVNFSKNRKCRFFYLKYIYLKKNIMKKQTLKEEIHQIKNMMKKLMNEQPFNDDGEPMMTHSQYRDYSEPSEPDYDEQPRYDKEDFNIKKSMENDLEKNDILLETFDGNEYFIRCKGHMDFNIYFINDEKIEIHTYKDNDEKGTSQTFGYEDALKFILSHKDSFLSFNDAVKEVNRENEIHYSDERNRRAESGFG